MKKSIFTICIILFLAIFLSACQQQTDKPLVLENKNLMSIATQKAEKIEVVHFHATQQCWACITVGQYALKTIKEKFPEEYKNGKIIFKDINGELPQNRDLVNKYRAGGSSLFVNAIIDGKDNIEEDITVWRLISNEAQFISYFQNKLNKLLGS